MKESAQTRSRALLAIATRMAALLAVLGMGIGAWAAQPPIYLDADGLALGGYDVVAYFQDGKAREGSAAFQADHKGARFRFASDANRKLFQAQPERYLPQFQGYCAYALAAGQVKRCDPRRFTVRDGKLYLFSAERARRRWSLDDNLFAKAATYWRSLLH
ncbi:MAG: hypothetical protein MUF01_16010 [Bryobacterales bacterium]|jgi:YHS domain-containing protein|nr:hypothetical protein [Bryobacterales bacterium]